MQSDCKGVSSYGVVAIMHLVVHGVPYSRSADSSKRRDSSSSVVVRLNPCAWGVSLLSTGANIPLAQVVVVTSCNLRNYPIYVYKLYYILYIMSPAI